jgi:hypothetical protein
MINIATQVGSMDDEVKILEQVTSWTQIGLPATERK